jgi:hypothetical protein
MKNYFKHPYESVIYLAEQNFSSFHYKTAKRLAKEAVRNARNEDEIKRAKTVLIKVSRVMKGIK